MSKRVCAEPGCPMLTDKTRCVDHARARDKARGTRQQRGYDSTHDRARARAAVFVATGTVKCWRCNLPIGADEPFDLGHDDNDRTVYRGPEHVGCNRATSGRNSPDA